MKIKERPEDFVVEEVIELDKTPGDYLYIKLIKKNRNTLDVINEISRKLRIPRRNISFAGTKDKVAITTQYISLYKANKKQVLNLKPKDVELIPLHNGSKPISLGDLKGNNFKIKIDFTPKKITKIINYFGPQRFSENNFEVGKAIVKKDFKKAIKLIGIEDSDPIKAITNLDKKLVSLYINSYQSYLWNKIAEVLPKDKDIEIPLFTFDIEYPNKEIESIYAAILDQEAITKKDFIIRALPNATPLASSRSLFAPIKNFKFEKPVVSFFLPKGVYATVALEQMM